MDALEVIEAIGRGEDSRHQFKRHFESAKQAAAEMAAFANSEGGVIFIGVDDDGTIPGLLIFMKAMRRALCLQSTCFQRYTLLSA